MNTVNNLSAISSNLLMAKMIQSKLDGRLAIVKRIDGDRVHILMADLGEKNFSLRTINEGFVFILDNASLVRTFFASNYPVSALFQEGGVYDTACDMYDRLNARFPDLMHSDIYQMLNTILDEVNKKSGL